MKHLYALSISVVLAGCAQFDLGGMSGPFSGAGSQAEPEQNKPVPRPDVETEAAPIGGQGQSAEAFDTTSEAEREAATQVTSAGALLGETVASLGDPSQPGFWLKTPLVKAENIGRVETAGGKSARVTLIPIEGEASAGSRISLATMRAIGLNLTDLATLKVFSG